LCKLLEKLTNKKRKKDKMSKQLSFIIETEDVDGLTTQIIYEELDKLTNRILRRRKNIKFDIEPFYHNRRIKTNPVDTVPDLYNKITLIVDEQLNKQKLNGKEFITDDEIDDLVRCAIEEIK